MPKPQHVRHPHGRNLRPYSASQPAKKRKHLRVPSVQTTQQREKAWSEKAQSPFLQEPEEPDKEKVPVERIILTIIVMVPLMIESHAE